MEQITLAASLRSGAGKGVARKLRAAEQIPAVLYGSGRPATNLSVALADLQKVLRQVRGDTAFLALAIEDQPPRHALMQQVQHDSLGRRVLHLDFLELLPDQQVTLEIPLEFSGQPQGVALGGDLHLAAHKIALRGRIAHIPPSLSVDISGLGTGQALHVADLPLPAGVEAVLQDNAVLASVAMPAKAEAASAEAAAEAEPAKAGKEPAKAGKEPAKAGKEPAKGGGKGKK